MSDDEWVVVLADWRRRHTWGGFLWPDSEPREQGPLRGREMLDEIEFLLSQGVHILLACQELRVRRGTVKHAARRHGRTGILDAFQAAVDAEAILFGRVA
ncbi:hypothetical protein [Gryllotalpicola protaetiae]|uniref:Uncharacterized protein n=1 Tax=Gryllotalpicola protaetiae TaxID=2419771 RepID=A0A387BER3_9MICO|nr:hypothetical protein [Gryllotalpicola protaetiae]AYG02393.1 hypothetical protein D7I44_01810 [Gryllotalpicola protaetiae]